MQPLNINDQTSIDNYSFGLDRLRRSAMHTPLGRGAQFDLTLTLPDVVVQPSDDNRRCIPQSFHLHLFNTSTTWYFIKPFKSVPEPLALVWLASTDPSASIDADSAPNDTGNFIVLKLLQASLMNYPNTDWPRDYLEGYQTPEQIVSKVEEVYRRMSDFQGRTLPYFFGREKRTAPNGEEIEILMFEYIHGTNLEIVSDNYQDPRFALWTSWSHLEPLAQAVVDTFRAAHSHQILHRDIKAENFVVDNEGKWVVVIDWEFCSIDYDIGFAMHARTEYHLSTAVFTRLCTGSDAHSVAVCWAEAIRESA